MRRLCGVLKPYMAAENDQVVIEGSIGRLFAHIDSTIICVRESGPPSPFMQRRDTILHKTRRGLKRRGLHAFTFGSCFRFSVLIDIMI